MFSSSEKKIQLQSCIIITCAFMYMLEEKLQHDLFSFIRIGGGIVDDFLSIQTYFGMKICI